MRKTIAMLLIATTVIFGVFANGSGESAASGDTYVIGFMGPLTGDNANYGIRCNNATQLAVSEINAAGGINGKQLVVIAENTLGTTEGAIAAYEKLVYSDGVCAIVGPVFTGPALAVAQRCYEDGIVMISPSATHKDVTSLGDFVYRTVPSDALQSEVAAHYMYEVLGYRNIACLYAMNDYSQGLALGVQETFTELGGTVSAMETCMVGDKDFRTQLGAIRNSGAEAIYIPNYTVEDALILEQAAQLGMDLPFFSSDGFSDPEIYNLAGDYTDGVMYVGPAQAEASSILADFTAAYSAAYDGDQPDSFATNAYDATYILAEAIGRAGSTDWSAINDQVKATSDFQGANGTINFAANGDMIASQGVYYVEGTTPVYQGSFQIVDDAIVQVD